MGPRVKLPASISIWNRGRASSSDPASSPARWTARLARSDAHNSAPYKFQCRELESSDYILYALISTLPPGAYLKYRTSPQLSRIWGYIPRSSQAGCASTSRMPRLQSPPPHASNTWTSPRSHWAASTASPVRGSPSPASHTGTWRSLPRTR